MKNNKFIIKFLLVIAFVLPFNICFAGYYDEYKNDLHVNRLALKYNAIWIAASKWLVKYGIMTEKEADWWIDLAKKEYFFPQDRKKTYTDNEE